MNSAAAQASLPLFTSAMQELSGRFSSIRGSPSPKAAWPGRSSLRLAARSSELVSRATSAAASRFLRLHYAGTLAPDLRGSLGQGGGPTLRTLLPDVRILSCRQQGGLPVSEHGCVPIQLARRIYAVPLTRDYLYVRGRGAERAHGPAV